MTKIGDKIKDVLTPGSRREEGNVAGTQTGYTDPNTVNTSSGQYEASQLRNTTTTGAAGYGVVEGKDYAEGERGAYGTQTQGMQTTGYTATGEGMTAEEAAVCGRETFAKVEDRPVVIEQKEYIKEHRPVEKEFVTETKFVGERETGQRTQEVIGGDTKVVAEAEPKAACDI